MTQAFIGVDEHGEWLASLDRPTIGSPCTDRSCWFSGEAVEVPEPGIAVFQWQR